jgi:drug/metabolite transporter (DMT)-like permease
MLTWLLIVITVILGSAGDVLCAKGMASGGEIGSFTPSRLGGLIRSIVVRRLVILGWICDAISFFSLLALLSVAQLSIAVPATALSFVVDTLGARFFLHEHVHWKRWLGVLLVTAGVLLTVQSGNVKVLTGTRGPAPAAVKPDHHQAGNHK